jgi:hypothetical protein
VKIFLYIVLFTILLTGCPEPKTPSIAPATPPQAPTSLMDSAPVISAVIETPVAKPVSLAQLTLVQNEIPTRQPTAPGAFNTWRTLADFHLTTSVTLDLHSVRGVCANSDEGEAGRIMFFSEESMVGFADLATLKDGAFVFAFRPPLLLTTGMKHHMRVIVESTHTDGDTLQVEVASIHTDNASSPAAIKWPQVRCW